MDFKLIAPFTAIHLIFDRAFETGLRDVLTAIQSHVAGPLMACVTLWIIVQGILVMRGDIDARRGISKVLLVSIVIGLVANPAHYNEFVVTTFEDTIPGFVREVSGVGLPLDTVPTQLDLMFGVAEVLFQRVAGEIGPVNEQDTLAFQGAQWILYGSLWLAFGIFDTVSILTKVLLTIGPIREIARKWVGQLITYGILLLLLNIVATIVIATEALALAAMAAVIAVAGTTAAKIIGLYELDMLFLTGNMLILALPTIATNLGGSFTGREAQQANSLGRRKASMQSQESQKAGQQGGQATTQRRGRG
jgi:type IV secretion system protein VirB6